MNTDPAPIRRLGALEEGMDILERRHGTGHMVRIVECDGVVDPGLATDAIRAVVARTPFLRTRIVRPPGEVPFFSSCDTEPRVTIVERDGPDDWARELREEFNQSLDLDGAVVRARILASEGPGGEIIVSAHHAVSDGRSLQAFCHDVIGEYERRIAGDTAQHVPSGDLVIPPALDQTLPEWMSGEGVADMLRAFAEANPSTYGGAPPASFVNERGSSTLRSATHVVHCQLTRETLKRVHDEAEAQGTTVQGAISAALLKAAAASGKVDVDQTFIVGQTIDLRPYLPRPLPLSDMGNYAGGVSAKCVDVAKSATWDVARDVTDQLHASMGRQEHLLSALMQRELNKALNQDSYEAGGFGGLCIVSNLGRLDPPLSTRLRPRAIHGGLPAHSFGNAYIYCFTVGHAESLLLNLLYPYPEMSHDTARGVSETMIDLLTAVCEGDEVERTGQRPALERVGAVVTEGTARWTV